MIRRAGGRASDTEHEGGGRLDGQNPEEDGAQSALVGCRAARTAQ